VKTLLTSILFLFSLYAVSAQDSLKALAKKEPVVRKDNYTVQYLIIYNEQNKVLLQKNKSGWHTIAIRSNENQSIKEALDSLARSIGLSIDFLKLAGLYTYKFQGLPDHKQVSEATIPLN
jgi:hypothetical protein